MTRYTTTGTAVSLTVGVLLQSHAFAASPVTALTSLGTKAPATGSTSLAVPPVVLNPVNPVKSLGYSDVVTGMTKVPGRFAISAYHVGTITNGAGVTSTVYRYDQASAVNGGGLATNAMILSQSPTISPAEQFTLWVDPKNAYHYAIQTENGDFVTAGNGGGLTTSDALQTFSNQILTEGVFNIGSRYGTGYSPHYTISTLRDYNYLTAVLAAAGSTTPGVFHTDAVEANAWEMFDIEKCGDAGEHSTYSLAAGDLQGGLLDATNGGPSSAPNALRMAEATSAPSNEVAFKLVRQEDGSYVFQTASGSYLTAIDGGHNLHDGYQTVAPTGAPPGPYQRFSLFGNDTDCSWSIGTPEGTYLSVDGSGNIVNVPETKATHWRMYVMDGFNTIG